MAATPNSRSSKQRTIRFVLRPYRRIPTWLVLYYLSGKAVGKGVVTNLSRSGMRIQGDHALEPGIDLVLRVKFVDDCPPVEVERATVRWVDGYDFGLHFAHLSPLATRYINDTLDQQIRAPQSPA